MVSDGTRRTLTRRQQGSPADLDGVEATGFYQGVNRRPSDAERLGGVINRYGKRFHVRVSMLPIRGERHAKLHMVAGASSSNGKAAEICQ